MRARSIREMIRDSEKRLIILINKTDTVPDNRQDELKGKIRLEDNDRLLFISAKEKSGLDELRLKLGQIVMKDKLSSDDVIITSIRHYEALTRVSESLGRVIAGLEIRSPKILLQSISGRLFITLGKLPGR